MSHIMSPNIAAVQTASHTERGTCSAPNADLHFVRQALPGILIGQHRELNLMDQRPRSRPWTITESPHYWDLALSGEELRRCDRFQQWLQETADMHYKPMKSAIGQFFLPPSEYVDIAPAATITVTNKAAGADAEFIPGPNQILLPVRLALPLFFNEVRDLRQTEFLPCLAHEIGHSMQLAELCEGDRSRFLDICLYEQEEFTREFFARLCERLICNAMQINLPKAQKKDFDSDDPYVAHFYADKWFAHIQQMRPNLRYRLARAKSEDEIVRLIKNTQELRSRRNLNLI